MTKYIGIDLGTSTTCLSVVEKGESLIIPGPSGEKVIPSYVYLREDGKFLIGEPAKAECIADPYNTIWATKRLIGRKFNDPFVQYSLKRLPYKISESKHDGVQIHGRDKTYPPEWFASLILKSVVHHASTYLSEPVKKAVITVPGTFNKFQREATQKSAEKIGLEVLRLVNEPTAAAVSWGFHKKTGQTVAVFDLGGGTFDAFIIRIGEGNYKLLAARGEPWLGGEDFDNVLVEKVASAFKKQYKINIYTDKIAHQRLKTAAEKAKMELSENDEALIYIPSICPDISRVADVNYKVGRAEFDGLIEKLVDRTIQIFHRAVQDAGLSLDDLDNVLMVGGMTRVPLVREKMRRLIGREPNCTIDPDEAVARGAAIIASGLSGNPVKLSPPASTKPADEYLSGDVDIHAMYAEAITRSHDPSSPDQDFSSHQPDVLPDGGIDTPNLSGAQNSSNAEQAPGAQLLLEVLSQSIKIEDLAKILAPTAGNGNGNWRTGGFTLKASLREGVRIKVYHNANGNGRRVMLGEFVIQSYKATEHSSPEIKVYFSVDKKAPFAVNAPILSAGISK